MGGDNDDNDYDEDVSGAREHFFKITYQGEEIDKWLNKNDFVIGTCIQLFFLTNKPLWYRLPQTQLHQR